VELEVKPSLWRYFSTPDYKKMLSTLDSLTKAIMHYIDEALQRIEQNPSKDPNQQGVLEKLLQQDRQTALIMAHDMLLAGVDTTSSVSTIVLYHLAKNPEKQQVLREEILKILPSRETPLTSENVKNLPYLRAVIKESIRMTTPILGNFRATGQDIVLQGYRIPKGVSLNLRNTRFSN
jgi:cytochrome P450 family 12